MKKIIYSLLILISLSDFSYSQIRDYELGTQFSDRARRSIYGGNYDYSDPGAVNIKVSVWGFVKYPGRYQIPDYTTILELMSYVGGPTNNSNLDDLRIYRVDENNNEQMLIIDVNDLMWEDELEDKYRKIPGLKPSDILVIPGEPRMFFMDWFSIGLSIFSALVSLTILVITIENK